jgi:hypothetical protein
VSIFQKLNLGVSGALKFACIAEPVIVSTRIIVSKARLADVMRCSTFRCRIREVPAPVLKECTALATLSVRGNPITVEVLRESDGFREFDARRVAKCDKQVHSFNNQPSNSYLHLDTSTAVQLISSTFLGHFSLSDLGTRMDGLSSPGTQHEPSLSVCQAGSAWH